MFKLHSKLALIALVANSCTQAPTLTQPEPPDSAPEAAAESARDATGEKRGLAASASNGELPMAAVPPEAVDPRELDDEAKAMLPQEMAPAAESQPPAAPDVAPAEANPSAPPLFEASAPTERPWPADCEERYVLRAHGAARSGDTSKYAVSPGEEYNVLFYFDVPWTGDVQLIEGRPLTDNPRIVHHWALLAMPDASGDDGDIAGGPDTLLSPYELGSEPVVRGVRGGSDLVLPAGVGMRVARGSRPRLGLEVHYFNVNDVVEEDASGFELCVTHRKRPADAAIHTLGKINFDVPAHTTRDISGHCQTAVAAAPVHLLSIMPHMHLTGTRMKVVLTRQSGAQIIVLDQPYSFQEQRSYPVSSDAEIMNPGDTLTTTCTFDNPTGEAVVAGDKSTDEMCQALTLAWPAGALTNGLPFGLLAGVPDELTCFEF